MVNDGPLVGSMWQGEYLLQASLGDPTHGVFRAQRRRDSQTVTLRLWRAPTDALASQFLEHASAACSIRHPALAQVEACGREEHFCFLVSEYVVGQKLDTWADQVGIPPLGEVIELMRRLCDGLQLAARSGVLHSALHPRNLVMLQAESAANRRQQPKLLDLGVPGFARPRSPHALAAQFMPPELLTCVLEPSEPALPAMSATMNVYACGALLYYLCTGGPPFRHSELSALHEAQLQGRLVLPSRINPQITPSLNQVIVQALALDPKQRYGSVSELAEALARVSLSPSVANARPVLSQPPLARTSSVPPPRSAIPGSRASAVGMRRISPPPAISVPPGIARRPPPAAEDFEPEQDTARTGRISADTVRPVAPDAGAADRDSAAVPAGSFSSQPPARSSHPPKPPQAVLATPLALFTGSGATQAPIEPPPAKPPARIDPNAPQLLGSHDRISAPPLREEKFRGPLVWLGSAAAAAGVALFVVVRMLGSSSPPISDQTPTVTVERPATDAPPLQPAPRPSAPQVVRPVPPVVPIATPSEPEPAPNVARESASNPRSSRRSPRSSGNGTGAVIATRESHSSNSQPSVVTASVDASARNYEPAPAPQPEASPPPVEAVAPALEVLAPARHEVAAAVTARSSESSAPAPVRPEVENRPLEARPSIGDVTIRGSLPTSWVRRAAERIRPQLAACYARAAQGAGKNQFGTLTVDLEIDERGRARSPAARGSGLAGLNDCVAEAAGKVICERAPDTGTVHASFKVIFTP
ncbi:MAG TPA: protein kinase [Polyangiales bacterium]|nr:protein kinase [Polyangiales bacterium]